MGTKPTDLTLQPYSSHLNVRQNTIPFTIKSKILIFLVFLKYKYIFLFRVCLFWVKFISGNAFQEMRVFGWSEK